MLRPRYVESQTAVGLFERITDQGRLSSDAGHLDAFDKLTVRMVCAAIAHRELLQVTFPDTAQHRAAVLLAGGLIYSAVRNIREQEPGGTVIYLGCRIGIRDQLGTLAVGRLQLKEVFSQTAARNTAPPKQVSGSNLPTVVCVYAPSDPAAELARIRPSWIAVDCGDDAEVEWLSDVLEYAVSTRTAVVCWSSNPLSSVEAQVESKGGFALRWPTKIGPDFDLRIDSYRDVDKFVTESHAQAAVRPLVMADRVAIDVSNQLASATAALSACSKELSTRLDKEVALLCWRLLRALERLPVPLSDYEKGASAYWGVHPIGTIRAAVERFLSFDVSDAVYQGVAHALAAMQTVSDLYDSTGPPSWHALVDLCLEDRAPGVRTTLVFPTRHLGSMFTASVQRRLGTTLQDLEDLGLRVETLGTLLFERHWEADVDEAAGVDQVAFATEVCLSCLPRGRSIGRMGGLLRHGAFSVLVYRFQLPALERLAVDYDGRCRVSGQAMARTLNRLSTATVSEDVGDLQPRVVIGGAVEIFPSSGGPIDRDWRPPPMAPPSAVSEIERLFEAHGGFEDDDANPQELEDVVDPVEQMVDAATSIQFEDRWSGIFAPDNQVNVVKPTSLGPEVVLRPANALRVGDRVLYVFGQRRQDLMSLLMSRLDRHPSMELNIALVARWQEEISRSFAVWQAEGRSLDDLFVAMVAAGSRLEGAGALRYWVSGGVLRPRDPEDLRRVAAILEMPFTAGNYRRIHAAGTRLHYLHVALAQHLNRWIRLGAGRSGMDDDIIDDLSGLTFGDIRHSLMLLSVVSVETIDGPFARSALGVLKRNDE